VAPKKPPGYPGAWGVFFQRHRGYRSGFRPLRIDEGGVPTCYDVGPTKPPFSAISNEGLGVRVELEEQVIWVRREGRCASCKTWRVVELDYPRKRIEQAGDGLISAGKPLDSQQVPVTEDEVDLDAGVIKTRAIAGGGGDRRRGARRNGLAGYPPGCPS